jgi:hypothetical protein
MAVVVQEVVGVRRGDRFYPHISGVARSFSYYATGNAAPEDGVVEIALGLGKTIVDDGQGWPFCPKWPRAWPPHSSPKGLLRDSQSRFWAVNMGHAERDPTSEVEHLVQCDLDVADEDEMLRYTASTYLGDDDRFESGIERRGPRLLNFPPVLSGRLFPFVDAVKELVRICREAHGCEIEIEFAATLDVERGSPGRFGFLQVRPMVAATHTVDVDPAALTGPNVLLSSDRVLGSGEESAIVDIVYLDPDEFDLQKTQEMVPEIEAVNRTLLEQKRPYILIGFGRWGTSDPYGGVPCNFGQIAGARVVVEAGLPGMDFRPSQGSHFFHNVTSYKVLYFSLPWGSRPIDWSWLRAQPEVWRGRHVHHVRAQSPLLVQVDGRNARGFIRT